MTSRKDQLKTLFSVQPEAEPQTPDAEAPRREERVVKRAASGAIRAMGLSLGALSDEVEAARRLRQTITAADQVVEIDPDKIDRSPFADRLSEGARLDETFAALKASMRERGQQVPVLLRPHPNPARAAQGMFQTAYGHRRVLAASELGIPVRAVVKDLSDDDLVIAQGKENAERRDLSFIERALFANALVGHGFDRATAMAALGVDKTEMSRLIQVAGTIPMDIARMIGPAPRAGRPRWQALGELLRPEAATIKAWDEMGSQRFEQADSDQRFQMLFDRLSRRPEKRPKPRAIRGENGRAIGDIRLDGKRAVLTIAKAAGEGFAEYLAAELPKLHAAYARDRDG
ncbi:MAG: plasmid partitioning protein RepB [Rhizobiaceae bacterium]